MPLADGSIGNTRGNSINGRANKDRRRKESIARKKEFDKLSLQQKIDGLPKDGAKRQRNRYLKLLEIEKQNSRA